MKDFFAILFTIAILLFAETAYTLEINFAPVLFYRNTKGSEEFKALGPVFEYENDGKAVRPLFYTDEDETDFLYPFGRSSKGVTRFLPIYHSDSNEPDPNSAFFPLFWGKHNGQSYGGLFPVYGKMLHRFGKDEAEFILWPLYMRTEVHGRSTYTILWPIFTVSKGKSYKCFPIYGWEQTLNGVSQYFLWPFFFRERGDKKMDAFLPFFQYTRWDDAWSGSIMWPFFSFSHDKTNKHISIEAPWPLVKYARGAYTQTTIFPIYYNYERSDMYHTRIYMWPIWYDSTITDNLNNYYKYNGRFLILTSWKNIKSQSEESTELNLWPLFYYDKNEEKKFWHFPSVFPFSYSGVENNWAPIFTFASYDKQKDKSLFNILWRTFYLERNSESMRMALSFLFSFEKNSQFWQIGFLSDLIRFKGELSDGNQTQTQVSESSLYKTELFE